MPNTFDLNDVISEEYRNKIAEYTNKIKWGWGGSVIGSVPRIRDYAIQHGCSSILDYGSGKSDFYKEMNKLFPDHQFIINQYEPARPEFAMDPAVSDMTICIDVLEHIEPDKLDNVLDHIYNKTNKVFYFKVCLLPAHDEFEDGQNLHLIVEPKEFWLERLEKQWDLSDVDAARGHVWGLAKKK